MNFKFYNAVGCISKHFHAVVIFRYLTNHVEDSAV